MLKVISQLETSITQLSNYALINRVISPNEIHICKNEGFVE